jgi:hypothetical protein
MTSSSRLYHCTRCHCQVIICRHCDRGNVYCPGECGNLARTESRKRAAQRYQNSHRGQCTNAARQSRFRARQRIQINKVTHQGSPPTPSHGSLFTGKTRRPGEPTFVNHAHKGAICCHFCGCEETPFLRSGFIRRAARGSPKHFYN